MRRLSPAEAFELLEHQGYAYLDVRSVPEFEQGHPAGAYNIPLLHLTSEGMRDNDAFLAQVSACFERSAKLVLGCRSGPRSLRAAELLLSAGYEHVVEQRAGLDGVKDAFGRVQERGWQATGLPVSFTPEPGRSFAELTARKD